VRNSFIDTIIDECRRRDDIFIISGDAGLGVFDQFKEQQADRFLNLGIAEQNMISHAAGMAMAGFKVYVYNITPFVLYRCYEQVRNDICYQKLPVTLVGIGCGLTYAMQGMTHYSIEDLGLARTLPNLQVFSPMDPIEARLAARYSLTSEQPMFVRLAKRGEPDVHTDSAFDVTHPQLVADGQKVALVFHGTVVSEVLKAKELLNARSIFPRIISLPMVQPLPSRELQAMLDGIDQVFVVEEHYADSGLGARLALEHARSDARWRLHCLGIEPGFVHEIKNQEGMREHYGISAAAIVQRVTKAL
jgi:transketolase